MLSARKYRWFLVLDPRGSERKAPLVVEFVLRVAAPKEHLGDGRMNLC